MFCPKCRAQVKEGASFCSQCGAVINHEVKASGFVWSPAIPSDSVPVQKKCEKKRQFLALVSVMVLVLGMGLLFIKLQGMKKNSGIRYEYYTTLGTATAYLVGPFKDDIVEIPQYVKYKGTKCYVKEVKLDGEHVLTDEVLILSDEVQTKEGKKEDDILERKIQFQGEEFQYANPLVIDGDVMTYVKEVKLQKHSAFIAMYDGESDIVWPLEKITALNTVMWISTDSKCLEKLKTVECSDASKNCGNIILSGEFPNLESLYGTGDMGLAGNYPALNEIEMPGRGRTLRLNGFFDGLEKLDVRGNDVVISKGDEAKYPVLKEIKGREVRFSLGVWGPSVDLFTGSVTVPSQATINKREYSSLRKSLPALTKISMDISKSSKYGDDKEFFTYLEKEIDISWGSQ